MPAALVTRVQKLCVPCTSVQTPVTDALPVQTPVTRVMDQALVTDATVQTLVTPTGRIRRWSPT
jgi:hypothetical protein